MQGLTREQLLIKERELELTIQLEEAKINKIKLEDLQKTNTDFRYFLKKSFNVNESGFYPNYVSDLLCDYATAVYKGDIKRLIVNVPPRCLKTQIWSIAFPAWVMGQDPSLAFVCVSYGQKLSRKFSAHCRNVMRSGWYKRAFLDTTIQYGRDNVDEFETTKGGGRFASSVTGASTGLGGEFIIIDDPQKGLDAYSQVKRDGALNWFDTTISSRHKKPAEGRTVLLQQRIHKHDLSGKLLERGIWEHLCVPYISKAKTIVEFNNKIYRERAAGECIFYNDELYKKIIGETREQEIKVMPPADYEAQYQQNPKTSTETLFKYELFGQYDASKPLPSFSFIVQSWDTATSEKETSDYSVCTTWGVTSDSEYVYLLDCYRKRLNYPDLRKVAIDLAEREIEGNKLDACLVEKKSTGAPLAQELRTLANVRCIAVNPKGSKLERANRAYGIIATGRVRLPSKAPYLHDFITEVTNFPDEPDDQVDSMTQAIIFISQGGRIKRSSLMEETITI